MVVKKDGFFYLIGILTWIKNPFENFFDWENCDSEFPAHYANVKLNLNWILQKIENKTFQISEEKNLVSLSSNMHTFCGGVVLNDNFILTAAHCLYE